MCADVTRGVRRTSFGERRWVWFLVLPLIFARPGSANELFLKAESFLQSPNSPQSIYIFNGTIDRSKYPTDFERLSAIVVKGADLNETATAEQLTPHQEYSVLNIESGDVGTYAIGVSTTTRVIEFSPNEFAAYLEAEKLVDDLAEFTSLSRSETVRERYTKYSKAIMQTGEQRSDAYRDRYGDLACSLDGRPSIFGAIVIRVDDLARIRGIATTTGVPVIDEADRVVIHQETFDSVLEFVL